MNFPVLLMINNAIFVILKVLFIRKFFCLGYLDVKEVYCRTVVPYM
jgi:hypothetical protein